MDRLYELITLIVVAIGVVAGIWQLNLIKKGIKADHDWNRRIASLKVISYDNPNLIAAHGRLEEHLKIRSQKAVEISLDRLKKLSSNEYPNIMEDLTFVLSNLEYMCVAMNNSIADEAVCKDLLRTRVVDTFRQFRQYIEHVRTIRNSTTIYENLEGYALKWGHQRDLKVRKPADS